MVLRFLHIILAFSLLSSQAGLPLWQHYCKGELKGTSWLSPADSCHGEEEEEGKSCHMANSGPVCPMHAAVEEPVDLEHHLESDCCSDELDLFKLAQLQQYSDLPDYEQYLQAAVGPAEVQIPSALPPRGETMLVVQLERPPPLIQSGRELRIRLESYLC